MGFTTFRIFTMVLSMTFSVIVLGLSPHIILLTTQDHYNSYFTFAPLAIATASLTMSTIPVMLLVDFIRRGAFTSMILVELIWFFILSVLWAATAGEVVFTGSYFFPQGCVYDDYSAYNQACRESLAVEAFSFMGSFLLLGYAITLLVFACIAASRGNSPWFSSVRETIFLAPAPAAYVSLAPPTQSTGQYPVAQPQYIAPVQPQYRFPPPRYSPRPKFPQSIRV